MARDNCPASFAKQVTVFYDTNVKSNTVEASDLWRRLVSAEPNFGKKFLADSYSCSEQLHRLIARLAPTLVRRDQNGVKGKGKGKGALAKPNARAGPTKGSGKGGSKGGGKGASFASLKIPDCFYTADGAHAPLTNACELHDGLLGVAHVDHAVARDLQSPTASHSPSAGPAQC